MLIQANPRPQPRALGIGPRGRQNPNLCDSGVEAHFLQTHRYHHGALPCSTVWRLSSFTNLQSKHLDKLSPKVGAGTAPHTDALTWLNRHQGQILAMPIFRSLSALRNSLLLGQQMLSSHTVRQMPPWQMGQAAVPPSQQTEGLLIQREHKAQEPAWKAPFLLPHSVLCGSKLAEEVSQEWGSSRPTFSQHPEG